MCLYSFIILEGVEHTDFAGAISKQSLANFIGDK